MPPPTSPCRSIPLDTLTKFAAQMAVPNSWRTQGASGSFTFQLPVLVPETAGEEHGSSAAWHAINEVPGLAVCCEGQPGVCSKRNAGTAAPSAAEWSPGADDALWMSFALSSSREAAAADNGDAVIATVSQLASPPADALPVACQLEFNGAVVAKGTALLQQQPREDGLGVATAGTMRLAVRTK